MTECAGNYFILNGELQPVELFQNSLVYEGESVYEVIRLMNGCPIFFSDHMERLLISARLQEKDLLAGNMDLRKAITTLVRTEKNHNINLKIVFNYNNAVTNYLVYFIETTYPTQTQCKSGVKGILYDAERKIPGSKIINHKLRSSICHKLIQEGAYEAVLVNEDGLITEGSRSNIFFLKNDLLITAPDDMVLHGITRKYILGICEENKIAVEFSCVKAKELKDYDAAFMTGTSPMVMPFSHIGNTPFRVNIPLIQELRQLYRKKAESSIRE